MQIIGGAEDSVDGCTHPVKNGDIIKLFDDSLTITCIHAPCHTRGHTLYYCDSGENNPEPFSCERLESGYTVVKNLDKFIFTGDTVFIGGCGRFFEGTPEEMLKNMDVMLTLPKDTKMFCGHEYTLSNFDFCVKAEG